jgi:transposase
MKAIKIRGTSKSIRRLVKLSKQAMRDGAYRVASRLHAVALNMEGKSAPDIANLLKVHRSKVSIWLQHWRREGMDGILEGHRSGRPSSVSESQRQRLSDILDSGPVAYGFTSSVWTSPMVTRVIEEEFSITYHPAHVSRLLHGLGFSVQRPKKLLAQADHVAQSRWIRYKYPNIKKKPRPKGRRSSSKTKRAFDKIPPSTEHGHE